MKIKSHHVRWPFVSYRYLFTGGIMKKSKQEIAEDLADSWILKDINLPIEFKGDNKSIIFELLNDGLVKTYKRHQLILPNFNENETVAVFSDYGGEEKNSKFYTYSFVLTDYNGLAFFREQMKVLREKYGMENPHKEISFKDAHYGPMMRCMDEYLSLTNNFVNGLLITVAINKEIISLCTSDNKKALKNITESITEYEYGKWKPFVLEKSMRIIYILTYLIKLLVPSGKKIFWMPDDDATMANERRAVDLTRMLSNALNSLKDAPKYKTIGYSMKPFNTDESYYMTDLLSLADLAAGSVEQYLTHTINNDEIFSDLAEKVLKWHSVQGIGLKKLIYVIEKENSKFQGAFLQLENEEYKRNANPVDVIYNVNIHDTKAE